MKTKFWKYTGVLVILLIVALCLPVAGLAETKTYEEHVRFSANDGIYFWFQPENFQYYNQPEIDQYLQEKFIRDWDENGTIESNELNENVQIRWSGATLTGDADYEFGNWGESRVGDLRGAIEKSKDSDDGKHVTLTLTNKVGDVFIVKFIAEYNYLVLNNPDIQTTGEISYEYVPMVTLDVGSTVTVTMKHQYDRDVHHTFVYEWFFENKNGSRVPLTAQGDTCTFTMQEEGYLICETNVYEGDMYMAYAFTQINLLKPTVKITFNVKTSHPVVDDVMTVTEGDTVKISTNAVCSDPDERIEYFWSIDTIDENGNYLEEVVQEGVGSTFTFTAKPEHNGKLVYCYGYVDANCEGDWLYYTLKVQPKAAMTFKTEYVEGIPANAVTEELKTKPELNTPAKIEAELTTKVLATAIGKGFETKADQVDVYEVNLMVSTNGGQNWEKADASNWPANGELTVSLPYPAGTNSNYDFIVAHMFASSAFGKNAGDIEYPAVRKYVDHIEFEVTGLSPIAIAWDEKPAAVTEVPSTGDNAVPVLWLMSMAMAAIGFAVLSFKHRQHN